jgi:recombination protein RecA
MGKEEERQRSILLRLARMPAPSGTSEAFFPTAFRALDETLGGGFPRGHMVELFGPSGCGKTSLAMQCLARAQKDGLTAAWIDADHTFDAAYAAALGVDMERVPFAQPVDAEQAMEITRTLVGSGAVDLVVVDSAAALVSRLELEAGIGNDAPGLHSRVLASVLQALRRTLKKSGACVVFLNQMRNRPEASSGEGETSAGGVPLKLFASVRIALIPFAGTRLALRVRKNKVAESVAESALEWRRGVGFVETP